MNLQTPNTDLQPDPDLEATKILFSVLWAGFIGQWGPEPGLVGRRHHCWRLRILLDMMEDVSAPWDNDDRDDVDPEWEDFLGTLPGFCSYWQCGCAWHIHGAERLPR